MEKNRFKEALLDKKEFIYTLELVPGRGSRGKSQDDILRIADRAAQSKIIHAVSITDNPGGHPALNPSARNTFLTANAEVPRRDGASLPGEEEVHLFPFL